ncbi:MAG: hypothetical protein ACYC64_19535 [Armatimonadota bacterium]
MMQSDDQGIVVSVPLRLKKRGGRKEVIMAPIFDSPRRPTYQEALVIAIARAYRWQRLLDEGKFQSISDLAREIGLDVSFAARLMRLTLLAPDIIEAILMGDEPSGLSLTILTKQLSPVWADQYEILGFNQE